MKSPLSGAVDAQHPWLGLVSYTEENRQYFHGRDDEARELVRRLERKTLTILFGQSGLGKSSLLQAGAFPRLRTAGFVPVYVRLDHGPAAPPLAEQLKPAVLAETTLMGTWSHSGSAVPGESLWEYFHHRDDVLRGGAGQQLTPVLVFDQFEELFTLGAADDATRARAAAFLAELADLVENRAPASFEARVDAGAVNAEAFDFARSDYRVLITLREDYLPHLESLKPQMPSLMQNRMRLTRLTGAQALEAVVQPAPGLVPDDVAQSIVAFVSGRSDLAQAEVEPSLLSLVCRELNHRRLAAGSAQIDAALLAGSRETILTEFYERTLADQPPAVRHWVENELLTDSGYRENIALERARKSLAAAGADPAAIDILVSRRLLRIEERLDVRRIELTHDVLCAVVRASRDARREREAAELAERRRQETEAELARARLEEAATRRSLLRARIVAVGAALLAVVAVAAAAWGFINFRRARAAEVAALRSQADAQRTRALADTARLEAEGLLNYLLNEFSNKLFDAGQLELFEQLSRRTVDYYRHLPAELVTESTERNRALALAMLGTVLNRQNRTDDAVEPVAEALTILRRRVAAGDHSFETAVGLSLTLARQADIYTNQSLPAESLHAMEEAVSIRRPLMADPKRSLQEKVNFGRLLMSHAWAQREAQDEASAGRTFAEAAEYLVAAGGNDPKNEDVASIYCVLLKGLTFAAQSRDDHVQARQCIEEAIRLENAILEQSPGRIPLLSERAGAYNALAAILDSLGKTKEGLAAAVQADRDYQAYLNHTPADGRSRQWSIGNQNYIGFFLVRLGRLAESRNVLKASLADARRWKISSSLAGQLSANSYYLARASADAGDRAGAGTAQADLTHYLHEWIKDSPTEHYAAAAMPEWSNLSKLEVDSGLGVPPAVINENARATLARLQKLKPDDATSRGWDRQMQINAYFSIASTSLDLGRYAEAESAAKAAGKLLLLAEGDTYNDDRRRDFATVEGYRAQAIAGEGHPVEARAIIDPLVTTARERAATAPDDLFRRMDLINALLIQAIAQESAARTERVSRLDEVQSLLASLPAEMAATTTVRKAQAQLAAERAKLERMKE